MIRRLKRAQKRRGKLRILHLHYMIRLAGETTWRPATQRFVPRGERGARIAINGVTMQHRRHVPPDDTFDDLWIGATDSSAIPPHP